MRKCRSFDWAGRAPCATATLELEFAVQYRGQSLSIRVSGRQVRVGAEAGPGRVVRVGCGDEVRELPLGETVVFVAGTGER